MANETIDKEDAWQSTSGNLPVVVLRSPFSGLKEYLSVRREVLLQELYALEDTLEIERSMTASTARRAIKASVENILTDLHRGGA